MHRARDPLLAQLLEEVATGAVSNDIESLMKVRVSQGLADNLRAAASHLYSTNMMVDYENEVTFRALVPAPGTQPTTYVSVNNGDVTHSEAPNRLTLKVCFKIYSCEFQTCL